MKTYLYVAFAVATSVLLLSGCGGSSSPAPTATKPRPSSPKYVKICVNGEEAGTGICPANPTFNKGANLTDWGCTRDVTTGLTWEASAPHRELITRNKNNAFTNYTTTTLYQLLLWTQPDPVIPQTSYPEYPTASQIATDLNALGYANHLNSLNVADALCGMKQWRVPHSSELINLSIAYLQGTYTPGKPLIAENLLIDEYFPDTVNDPYLTSGYAKPRAGEGKDGEDLYADNVWFQGNGLASFAQPVSGSIYAYVERKHPKALRLVADACATCYPVQDNVGTRWLTQSTVLNDGRVLVTGGSTFFAELYDPQVGTWSPVASLPATGLPINRHTSTLLPNGKVLIVGGVDASNSPIRNTWLFDPLTNIWQAGPSTKDRHAGHAAIKLSNGKVVVAGGDCAFGSLPCYSGSTELYDGITNSFSALAAMPIPVKHAAAALLSGDKIFVGGGSTGTVISDAQIYDFTTNKWRILSTTLASPRLYHTATTLNDGTVLIVGGFSAQGSTGGRWNSSDIYNPVTDSISQGPNMQYRRVNHTATLLADGRVLVTGGSGLNNDGTTTKTVEYFDPALNQWLESCSLITPRGGHTAALLNNGNLLIAGGVESGVSISNSLKTAQIWRR